MKVYLVTVNFLCTIVDSVTNAFSLLINTDPQVGVT